MGQNDLPVKKFSGKTMTKKGEYPVLFHINKAIRRSQLPVYP